MMCRLHSRQTSATRSTPTRRVFGAARFVPARASPWTEGCFHTPDSAFTESNVRIPRAVCAFEKACACRLNVTEED